MTLKGRVLKYIDPYVRIPIAGMDISDETIKFLKFGTRGELTLDFFAEEILPKGLIESGEIKKEEELAREIVEWRKTLGRGLRTSFVAVSLPEEKSFLRMIQLPKVKLEDLGRAIQWEIEANIPLSSEELVYDYELVEPPEARRDHFDVIITAFPRLVVEAYVRVLKLAGFTPAALELESQAIVRAIIKDPRARGAKIIVDLGRTRTSLILFAGNAIIYTKTIAIGGKIMEENIAKTLGVQLIEAEKIKKTAGLNKKDRDGAVFNALRGAVSALAEELQRTISYFESHAIHGDGTSGNVEEILLVGGEAHLLGLPTYLSARTKIPVRLGDPLEVLRERLALPVLPIPHKDLLPFTTAVGLALRDL